MTVGGDLRFAIRNLTRSPGYTAVVVATLALGIGASAAIFSIVNAVVLRPLPYPNPDQLVRITSELRGFGATDTGVAAAEMYDYQARSDVFAGVAGVMPVSANVTSGDVPVRVELLLVSWNYFSVLGVAPAHGRIFNPSDDTAGVANLAVVSDGFWRRHLRADPQAVGRTVVIDEDPVLVVGVMPPGFSHPGRTLSANVDVWSPAGFGGPGAAGRSRRRLEGAVARLGPGVTREQAEARLHEYGETVSRDFPADYPQRNGWRPRVVPLEDDVTGNVAAPMFILLSGVGLLLLVACVNVAHLVLARSTARRTEMAIRQALGAGAGRLALQLLAESALLAAAGGALALLVASWGLRGLVALAPGQVRRLDEVGIDGTTVLIIAGISVAVALVFGLVPAVQHRRIMSVEALKEGGRGTARGGSRGRSVLVAAEVAMATVLLIGAGLLVRSVVALLNVPVGFETDHLVTARLTLPRPNDVARATYLDPERRVAFYRETLRRVSAMPGVASAAMSTQIPLGGFNPPLFVEIDGRDTAGGRVQPVVHHFQVSPGYFETLGVRIVRGRPFTGADRAGTEPVAIVSETAARSFWPDGDPLGKRVRFGDRLPWMTVVGVAADVLNRRLTESAQPILYATLEQSSDLSLALLIRTAGDTPNLAQQVAAEVRAVDPDLPLYALRTMEEVIGSAVAQRRFLMRLLVIFGAVATALALLGIYGVMAYSVSQRTREIGIRMAIGARQADVSRMVVRGGLVLTAAGVVAGIVAWIAVSGVIRSQLFNVKPADPLTIASVLVLMAAVAGAAAWLPARRAARVDPVVALRAQ